MAIKQRVFLILLLLHFFSLYSQENLKKDYWYANAVIYNMEIAVFFDSDGDGTGDFQGAIQKLDYLKSLGIDAIWLAPIMPSPGEDDGYDVVDFYGINPKYGSAGDFSEFVYQAKIRGMKIIMDLPLNHTSTKHPWFQEARKHEDSPYRDWYIWSEDLPENWDEGMVFPGVEESTWSYDEEAKAYYFHRFYNFQADLNYTHPPVKEEAKKIIGFWLGQQIDGFRLDAVPFILEQQVNGHTETVTDFDFLEEIRMFSQWRRGDVALLGEANVLPSENANYFGGKGNGLHMMFNFYVNQHLFLALAARDIQVLANALQATKEVPDNAQWANFLRNHDELDLGRLSDQQRELVFQQFGPDKNMQLYDRGIRRRLAPMLDNRKQLELAYSLMFSLPGTPVIRYGDEIGMGDDLTLEERIAVRTPMQWTNDKNAGFTTADEPFRPLIDEGPYSYNAINVRDQLLNDNSLLNWTREMIRLRKNCPEIGLGEWEILNTESQYVLAISYKHEDDTIIVLHNFSDTPQEIILETEVTHVFLDLMEPNQDLHPQDDTLKVSMEPFGYKWYRANIP